MHPAITCALLYLENSYKALRDVQNPLSDKDIKALRNISLRSKLIGQTADLAMLAETVRRNEHKLGMEEDA